ncbi:hypothetical protein NMY22_g12847 [Coprinellus aureogranulatus]|nr:hypothetical protein NMY22_g12847 [Coprinellus aureogranulatus]
MTAPPPIADRPLGKTLCLFDVDGTLSLARQASERAHTDRLMVADPSPCAVGFVGGSDLVKITEQLQVGNNNGALYHPSDPLAIRILRCDELQSLKTSTLLSRKTFVGEERYKELVKFILHYIADLDIPIKRGTFVEFRKGMINVSPIGRNATIEERIEFEKYDKEAKVRATMVQVLREKFADYGLTFSIGGQISFGQCSRTGGSKTYAA